jgi:hypothetical protein
MAGDDTAGDDVAGDSAPVTGTATVTTLPPAGGRTAMRWLPAAAAVVLLLAGVGYGITRLGNDDGGATAASGNAAKGGAASTLDLRRSSTGTDYSDRASLAAAVPSLLAGRDVKAGVTAQTAPAATEAAKDSLPLTMAAPDALARLRSTEGLAQCLVALLPPDDPSVVPLALDYAMFRGAPAMVVVLPAADSPAKLDIFVVGPACSPANDSVLFYTSVDKP